MGTQHNLAALPMSLFEKREELRRVLLSKHFANAPKRSRFLEFVAEQTLLGNAEKLNEYLIAWKFTVAVLSSILSWIPSYGYKHTTFVARSRNTTRKKARAVR